MILKATEEELEEAEELIGATGNVSPVNGSPMSVPEPEKTSNSRPSQATLNELESMENRMNSRMERFEALVVSGAPSVAATTTETRSAPPPAT